LTKPQKTYLKLKTLVMTELLILLTLKLLIYIVIPSYSDPRSVARLSGIGNMLQVRGNCTFELDFISDRELDYEV